MPDSSSHASPSDFPPLDQQAREISDALMRALLKDPSQVAQLDTESWELLAETAVEHLRQALLVVEIAAGAPEVPQPAGQDAYAKLSEGAQDLLDALAHGYSGRAQRARRGR